MIHLRGLHKINSYKLEENGLIIFPVTMEDGTSAELHIHPTDEGLVYDLVQGDDVIQSAYQFVDDLIEMTH